MLPQTGQNIYLILRYFGHYRNYCRGFLLTLILSINALYYSLIYNIFSHEFGLWREFLLGLLYFHFDNYSTLLGICGAFADYWFVSPGIRGVSISIRSGTICITVLISYRILYILLNCLFCCANGIQCVDMWYYCI